MPQDDPASRLLRTDQDAHTDPAWHHLRAIDYTLRAVAVGGAVLLVCYTMQDILLLGFAAVLFAVILAGCAQLVQRITRAPYGWSLTIFLLSLLAVAILVIWWRGPQLANEAGLLFTQLVAEIQVTWQHLDATPFGARVADKLMQAWNTVNAHLTGYVSGLATSTLGISGDALLVIATALFLAAAPGMYLAGAVRLMPLSWRPRSREVLCHVGDTLWLWFMGQLFDMLVVAILAAGGLYALGVPLAGALAACAGLLNFVPFIGAFVGAAPAVLVGMAKSPMLAVEIVLLFLVVQTIEGYVTAPLIQRRTVSLPPVLTIASQAILASLFGIFGLVLATPVMAAALTAVRMVYVETVLEHRQRQ